jgi:hypothetical protein
MNRVEVALLLTAAAARDLRTIGEADVLAWFEDIGDLDYQDCRAALRLHYRDSTERIMPAHVRRLVRQVRDERRRLEGQHEVRALPSRFEDDDTRGMRIRDGVQQCRDVLTEVMARLEVNRAEGEADRVVDGRAS